MKKKTNAVAKNILMSVPVREVYIHKHVGKVQPVDIAVFIDYQKGTISLIETFGGGYDHMRGKQYMFAGRGLEYMAGWRDVLDAIRAAIDEAEGRLSIYQKERELELAMVAVKNV